MPDDLVRVVRCKRLIVRFYVILSVYILSSTAVLYWLLCTFQYLDYPENLQVLMLYLLPLTRLCNLLTCESKNKRENIYYSNSIPFFKDMIGEKVLLMSF